MSGKNFTVSPFTGNVFEKAGRTYAETGDSLPVRKSGQSAWPFNRVPLIDASGMGEKVHRPYEQSPWVMRAIKEIAGPIYAVQLKFRAGEKEITDAPWLSYWKMPVAGLTRQDFIEAIVGWLKLAGEAFLILPPEFTVPFPDRVKAWPKLIMARPDRMRPVKTSTGELSYWEYQGPTGQRTNILPDQVIQPKYWNPYDPIRGMSEYESARVATEADYLSGKFALNLARANGDTGLVITTNGGAVPDDAQQQQIRTQLELKRQKSLRGEFSSIFLPADLKAEKPQVQSTDENFVGQRLENRHEIYIAFGVPPSMADVVASYSVGSASDWYRLITGACQPTGEKVCGAISSVASLQNGSPVEAYLEWSEHPVMQAVRREKIDSAEKLFSMGMPVKQISKELDLNFGAYPGDNVGYLPATLLAVDSQQESDPTKDPALAEPDDSVSLALLALRRKSVKPKIMLPAPDDSFAKIYKEIYGREAVFCGCSCEDRDMVAKGRSEKDIKLWKSIVACLRGTIRAYVSKFNRVLMLARSEVLRKLERAAAAEKSLVTKHVAADFLFKLDDFDKPFQAAMRSIGIDALQKAGDQVFAEIGKTDPWKMPPAEALQFLKDRENKLSGVGQQVFDRIRKVISQGLLDGDPLRDIADAVRTEFNDIGKGRAMVIAQTETAAAYGTARHEAISEAGIQYKRWLTSGNSNVRSAHELMNGTILGIDEPFIVTNPKDGDTDEVMHPADPDGAEWNVINCHCVEVASADGPDDK